MYVLDDEGVVGGGLISDYKCNRMDVFHIKEYVFKLY